MPAALEISSVMAIGIPMQSAPKKIRTTTRSERVVGSMLAPPLFRCRLLSLGSEQLRQHDQGIHDQSHGNEPFGRPERQPETTEGHLADRVAFHGNPDGAVTEEDAHEQAYQQAETVHEGAKARRKGGNQ